MYWSLLFNEEGQVSMTEDCRRGTVPRQLDRYLSYI